MGGVEIYIVFYQYVENYFLNYFAIKSQKCTGQIPDALSIKANIISRMF